jgi:sugar fermentation stimulation protein A
MADMVEEGCRAVMFYLVQRDDCDHFRIAADIDPHYAERLAAARKKGVETICYTCRISLEGIELDAPLPLALD